jgi:hypothetical protein
MKTGTKIHSNNTLIDNGFFMGFMGEREEFATMINAKLESAGLNEAKVHIGGHHVSVFFDALPNCCLPQAVIVSDNWDWQ